MSPPAEKPLKGARVLIVEDEYLIATDLASHLTDIGVNVVGPVPSCAEALRLISDAGRLDAAILDINLGSTTVYPVADVLTHAGVPFVFATGYDDLVMPPMYEDVPRHQKPVDHAALAEGLRLRIEGWPEHGGLNKKPSR
jgi:CheY-like chemotaxis protein